MLATDFGDKHGYSSSITYLCQQTVADINGQLCHWHVKLVTNIFRRHHPSPISTMDIYLICVSKYVL